MEGEIKHEASIFFHCGVHEGFGFSLGPNIAPATNLWLHLLHATIASRQRLGRVTLHLVCLTSLHQRNKVGGNISPIVKERKNMYILRIEHPVPNYTGWKQAFDSDPIGRKKMRVRRSKSYTPSTIPTMS